MAKKQKQKIVLLDAHAIIHRAYHALPDFSSSKGEPTGALFGLSTMLIKIIQDLKPDYVVACYDLPEPTFRHEVFKEYKDGRKETEPELKTQLQKSREVFEAFSIPIYEASGFEADDILGTIVEQVDTKKYEVVIASGDMDTMQLVKGEDVYVYTLKKGIQDTILYDEKAVVERFGFAPKLLVDYKGLRGDPSDNIPGIRGIGEKTATQLITTFGTVEDIYKAVEDKKKDFTEYGFTKRIQTLLREGKEEAFFSKMLATIRTDAPIKYKVENKTWKEAVNIESVFALFDELEFRTLTQRLKTALGIQTEPQQEKKSEKIDPEVLKRAEIALWLLHSDITSPTQEDVLRYGKGKSFQEIREMLSEELKEKGLDTIFLEIEEPLIAVIEQMNTDGIALDIEYLKKLSKKYHKVLDALEKKIYTLAGVEFNINSPKQLGEVLFDTLGLIPRNQKRTTTGQRSTKESELEKLQDEHEIIPYILQYRELKKLLSTYIDALPKLVASDGRLHAEFLQAGTTTGRMASQNPNLQNIPIKTELGKLIRNAFVAEKGYSLISMDYSQVELRIASVLSQDEKLIKVFKEGGDIHTSVASEVFGVSADAVTKEMRRKAKVINFGILYGMGVNALKANLGGETTQKEARAFYDAYFDSYKGLAQWIDDTKAIAHKRGYTTTVFGRRRYFEGLDSSLPQVRAAAERMAINAPVQGTSADIIKKAMVAIDAYIKEKKIQKEVRMVSQIHDELIFEVKDTLVEEIIPILKNKMETGVPSEKMFGVPLVVDVAVGKNWGEMKSRN